MAEKSQSATSGSDVIDTEFEFIDGDNVTYRRRKNKATRSVDDVLNPVTGQWRPYEGNRLQRGIFGSSTTDPAKRK